MSALKPLIRSGLRRLGYTIQRLPTPAYDAQFALQVDFGYVLAHYLATRDDTRPFSFLQVGANDGVTGDPLHEHVRLGGWHVILVEPQPTQFRRLVENYAGAQHLTFVNAAISDRAGQRQLYVIQDETGAPIETLGILASFREAPLLAFHRRMESHYPGSRVGSVEVECTTFADVLADTSYLDLLSIDVEGWDVALLQLFDFGRIRPPIVRFEHRHVAVGELDDAVELLAAHGYRMVREEYDMTAYRPPMRARV
jgi:FkbM family methyltransferase